VVSWLASAACPPPKRRPFRVDRGAALEAATPAPLIDVDRDTSAHPDRADLHVAIEICQLSLWASLERRRVMAGMALLKRRARGSANYQSQGSERGGATARRDVVEPEKGAGGPVCHTGQRRADLTSVGYKYMSDGRLFLEAKEDIKSAVCPRQTRRMQWLCFSKPDGSPFPQSTGFHRKIEYFEGALPEAKQVIAIVSNPSSTNPNDHGRRERLATTSCKTAF
jgi:hypothetical protein